MSAYSMILALLAVLLISSARADDTDCPASVCAFEAFQPITIEEVENCYKCIKADLSDVKKSTLSSIRKYLDLNVFYDYYRDQSLSKMDEEINLKDELDKIEQIEHIDEYDFHWDIVQLMLRIKDPHSVYRFPTCFSKVYYVLPFAFNSVYEDGTQKIVLTDLPTDYAFVTVYYQKNKDGKFEGVDELLRAVSEGLEVQEMNIKYNHPNDYDHLGRQLTDITGKTALEAMKIWSDRHQYISKNRGARFNSTLRSDFYLHSSDYGMPHYDIEIKVGGVWFTVPWIAIPSQSIGGIDDLLSICPLKISSDKNNYNNLENMETLSKEEVIRRIKKSAEERMITTMSEKPLTPKVTSKYTNTHGYANSETIRGYVHDDAAAASSDNNSTLTRIYVGDNISLRLYHNVYEEGTDADGNSVNREFNAYVIAVPSFSPSNYDQFTTDMQEIFDYIGANKDNANTIIIDVRENGGGYVDLGNKLLYYLVSPEVDSNSSGLYMRKKCPLNDYFAENEYMSLIDGDDGLYDYYSHSLLNSDEYYQDSDEFVVEYTIEDGTTNTTKYMTNYTFSPLDFYDYSGQRRSDKGDTYNANLNLKFYFDIFNSEDIDYTKFSVLVVTDGTCGSTCATFLNHAVEIDAVTVIGVGGLYGDNEQLSVSSFAGGSVLDSQSFEDIFNYLGVDSSDNDAIPEIMPRDNYIRFPYNALMSFRDYTTPLEFEQLPVHISVPYFAPLSLSVTDSIKQMLDFVVPEIIGNDYTNTNSKANTKNNYIECDQDYEPISYLDNARYGRFYDPENSKFTDECVPVGCESGYYPKYGGEADESRMDWTIIECIQLGESVTATDGLSTAAIVCIILAVVVCVLVALFWVIRIRQGKSFGDTGLSKEKICPCCFRNKNLNLANVDNSDDDRDNVISNVEVSSSEKETSTQELIKK